ncbi:MAG: tRNA1(Val) (adenine(37)-N6)-methyltransferase [Blautia sp.]|nr:tRNA1(Val) (adenine(37)-N6)-methyltransferase [Blautia sp.]
MPENLIKPNERLDDLQNGFYLIQDPAGFCFGMDAVLLSSFANVHRGDNVLDLGTGTGILPVLLAARTTGSVFTGLEIQPESADMAARSVIYNHLEDRITILRGDIKEAATLFGAASFRVVVCNPPYLQGGHGKENGSARVSAARHEILCTLEDVISQTAAVLKDHGRFYMVHRPQRMAEIISMLHRYRLEPKRLRLVHPYMDKEPNLVLIESVKGVNPGLRIAAPLIVCERGGGFTEEIKEIYGNC